MKSRRPPSRGPGGPPGRQGPIGLRPLGRGEFELVHPRFVEELWDDYEEAMELLKENEVEAARDALRFALEGSDAFLQAHVALGRIALETDRDLALARGHFGYVVELVERALARDFSGKLPSRRPANGPFYEAVEGLARCYEGLGKKEQAREVRNWASRLDSSQGRTE